MRRNCIIGKGVATMKGVTFPQPGIFLVELLLDNQWAADTTVELK
jgi:hypothetical protein